MADLPVPDQILGAPHPRAAQLLFGQNEAQAEFLSAYTQNRLHHAWLLSGPRGVGKATLAWRIARFLRAAPDLRPEAQPGAPPPRSLDVPGTHPAVHLLAAGADPGVRCVTRTANDRGDRLRTQIVVDDIRSLASFFQLSSPDGARRVVIIDAADEMNVQAANALLKILEEPPERTTLLLIAHQPGRLLPTIRSRCRGLRLRALDAQSLQAAIEQAGFSAEGELSALNALAAGSAGAAIRLAQEGAAPLYAQLVALIGGLPRLERTGALSMAESMAGRGAENRRQLFFELLQIVLARLAKTGATGAPPLDAATVDEAAIFARLAPTPRAGQIWADVSAQIDARARHGLAVNLDPAALVLDSFRQLALSARTIQPASVLP